MMISGLGTERGVLVLADLSGYTQYLGGVELDHSHDVLADLIGQIAEQLEASGLPVAKLEGDCVFCAGDIDGITLRTAVESTYYVFRHRRRAIARATTCGCDACRRIEELDLKAVAHYGEWVGHEVAGRRELTGAAVVTAHRLLKNSIEPGRAYAFLSEPLLEALAMDGDGLAPHLERYDDIGEVRGLVLDLEQRWREHEGRRPVLVDADAADMTFEADVAAPPARVFEALTDPAQQRAWRVGLTDYDSTNPSGGRGIGTEAHCVHGKTVITHEIVDWQPPRYFSFRERNPLGPFLWTIDLEPLDAGATHMTWRAARAGGRAQRMMFAVMAKKMRKLVQANVDALAEYAASRSRPSGP